MESQEKPGLTSQERRTQGCEVEVGWEMHLEDKNDIEERLQESSTTARDTGLWAATKPSPPGTGDGIMETHPEAL
jgi:hypothetical protein